MSWSIWQALWARDAAIRRAEPTTPPRTDRVPSPSLKVLHEIFRPPMPPQQEAPGCVPQPKEAQVP
jgi:hypothetical protein